MWSWICSFCIICFMIYCYLHIYWQYFIATFVDLFVDLHKIKKRGYKLILMHLSIIYLIITERSDKWDNIIFEFTTLIFNLHRKHDRGAVMAICTMWQLNCLWTLYVASSLFLFWHIAPTYAMGGVTILKNWKGMKSCFQA